MPVFFLGGGRFYRKKEQRRKKGRKVHAYRNFDTVILAQEANCLTFGQSFQELDLATLRGELDKKEVTFSFNQNAKMIGINDSGNSNASRKDVLEPDWLFFQDGLRKVDNPESLGGLVQDGDPVVNNQERALLRLNSKGVLHDLPLHTHRSGVQL